MTISVVVPIYNELENIPLLYQQLAAVLPSLNRPWEIVFVDDGSTDGSSDRLKQIAVRESRVKVVHFRRNYGQTAAMQAGIQHSAGETIVTLDGDLQNDPLDIPTLVQKLDEGYDLVHGWRKLRQDTLLTRKVPSRIANWLISKVTRFPIHDLGCTLKAMRREIADELELYGEMHRFIPILAHQRGARCCEVVTRGAEQRNVPWSQSGSSREESHGLDRDSQLRSEQRCAGSERAKPDICPPCRVCRRRYVRCVSRPPAFAPRRAD